MQVDRLKKLLEFLENEPEDPFLLYALATEYMRLDQVDQALAYYEKLVREHPGYVGTYYHLGKLYEALNRRDDAVLTYENGMKTARAARDNHALSELQGVYNELMDE
jgi:tetratricopeptide (TPR) repeat protein